MPQPSEWKRMTEEEHRAFRAPGEQLAREVAAGLGPEWVGALKEQREGFGPYVVELVNGNARIQFNWKDRRCEEETHYHVTGRIEYQLAEHARGIWSAINISRQKSPARIAREIERRFLPTFLAWVRQAEQNLAAHAASVQLADYWARRLVQTSAGQLEGKLPEDQLSAVERLSYRPRWPATHGPGPGTLVSGAERLELCLHAETAYHPGVDMVLHLTLARAERVIHFLWEQGFFEPPQETPGG